MDSGNCFEKMIKELKDTETFYRRLEAIYDRSAEEMERVKENLKVSVHFYVYSYTYIYFFSFVLFFVYKRLIRFS